MASASFQVVRGALSSSASDVTEGTAAPTTANDIEVRIDLAAGWTKREIKEALGKVWEFLDNPNFSPTIPL